MTSAQTQAEPVERLVAATDVQPAPRQQPEVREIPLEKIRIGEFCERGPGDDDLSDLTQSMPAHGLLQPVLVRQEATDTYTLIAGRRRFLAAGQLKWPTIPCLVLAVTHADEAVLALIENEQRKALTPLQEARSFKQLKERFGMTEEDIGRQVGLPQSTVSERIILTNLPEDLQKAIGSLFTCSHAVLLARILLNDPFAGEHMARQLYGKVLNGKGKVSTSDLRAAVKMITDGEFGKLPDTLQHFLLTEPRMTTEFLAFSSNPEGLLDAAAAGARMKEAVRNWPVGDRVKFIEQCVKRGRTFAEAKALWVKRMARLASEPNAENRGSGQEETTFKKISDLMAAMMDGTQRLRYHCAELDGLEVDQLTELRTLAETVREGLTHLIDFMDAANRSAAETVWGNVQEEKEATDGAAGQD